MQVEIKMVEVYNNEVEFATKVAKTMEEMDTDLVKFELISAPMGNLYSGMIIKITKTP